MSGAINNEESTGEPGSATELLRIPILIPIFTILCADSGPDHKSESATKILEINIEGGYDSFCVFNLLLSFSRAFSPGSTWFVAAG